MKAAVLHAVGQPLALESLPYPAPAKGEVVVDLHAAALNHRDLFITQGLYAGIRFPSILGSDGAGTYQGRRVLLYPALEWGTSQAAQSKAFRVLGMPDAGTFASQIAIPKANIHDVPPHLSWEQAAALPLAGLTAWRTLFTRCKLRKSEKILISGIGGGVALAALQFAVATGAEVWVTSGSDAKIAAAVQMGAKGGANYTAPDWDKSLKQAAGGFDVVVDAAGGDGFALFAGLCNPGARIGFYGATHGKVGGLSLQPLFWKQISVLGSTMGSPTEFKAMLRFVEKHGLVPVTDATFPLEHVNNALARMQAGGQFGKIVLQIK
jgi:zinc-binding alcohol dehydrogenase/oxidoreductase